jgi:hypothetical protein
MFPNLQALVSDGRHLMSQNVEVAEVVELELEQGQVVEVA